MPRSSGVRRGLRRWWRLRRIDGGAAKRTAHARIKMGTSRLNPVKRPVEYRETAVLGNFGRGGFFFISAGNEPSRYACISL